MEILKHGKETFMEYLTLVGCNDSQVEKILNRFIKQKPTQEDCILFQQYIAGKDFKNLYDEL